VRGDGEIVLVSCYELGHQPLALASPLAFLRQQGFAPACLDLSVDPLDEAAASALARARLVAISVPMHTALRLGVRVASRVRALNPGAHICFYGLYAPLNARYLLSSGADSVRGGEYEVALVELAQALDQAQTPAVAATELRRLPFLVPQRDPLPPLRRYAHLVTQEEERLAGYVEATRGCRHLCRHCPIPAVYAGRFFAVPVEVVLADARQQIAAGARHITFGDPDFLNGPKHALAVARALHHEHPEVTFDATIKVEHILQHRDLFPELARLGCLFVVSAVESLSDAVLTILDKGHRQDDAVLALQIVREAGISLRPTFVPFTPWTTREGYVQLCRFIGEHDLEDEVDPIQLALRLLIPPGSLLLEREELRPFLGELDEAALTYRWRHPDPEMDRLQEQVSDLVEQASRRKEDPALTFRNIHELAVAASGDDRPCGPAAIKDGGRRRRSVAPRLSEPWFCCAEPSRTQRDQVSGPADMPLPIGRPPRAPSPFPGDT
jgi:radical SAM superfamily enzyme YgiQ (UPF0313 family)